MKQKAENDDHADQFLAAMRVSDAARMIELLQSGVSPFEPLSEAHFPATLQGSFTRHECYILTLAVLEDNITAVKLIMTFSTSRLTHSESWDVLRVLVHFNLNNSSVDEFLRLLGYKTGTEELSLLLNELMGSKSIDCVKLMMRSNPPLNDRRFDSTLQFAFHHSPDLIPVMLRKGACPDLLWSQSNSCFLIDLTTSTTPLSSHLALKQVLESDEPLNVNVKNLEGMTALASLVQCLSIYIFLSQSMICKTKQFHARQVSPLYEHLETFITLVKLLVERGGDVNCLDLRMCTPLGYIIEIVEYLENEGPNVLISYSYAKNGRFVGYDYLSWNIQLADILIDHGALVLCDSGSGPRWPPTLKVLGIYDSHVDMAADKLGSDHVLTNYLRKTALEMESAMPEPKV